MKRWDLTSLAPSSEKAHPREPGPDAPRVPRRAGQMPRVLFSSPDFRVVVVDLEAGGRMGEHRVRERALVQVVAGRVTVESADGAAECGAGSLLAFEPGEPHDVRALETSRLLLVLAPWPAPDHYPDGSAEQHLPANAVVEPLPPPAD